jgi:methionyl aminopeptidase
MIILKNDSEIEIMVKAGKMLKEILNLLSKKVEPSITTKEIENYADELFKKYKVKSSFYHYNGYPASICVSVNDEIVHGIPGNYKIKNGDIVSIDAGLIYKGFNVDSAITVSVGKVRPEYLKLIEITKKSLDEAIKFAIPDNHLSDISAIIQKTIERSGFQVIKECSGHGIGRKLHEDPSVPNFGNPGAGVILKPGMTLAIEPMAVVGKSIIKMESDGWTISTVDGSVSAHFEHTVAITESGVKILT